LSTPICQRYVILREAEESGGDRRILGKAGGNRSSLPWREASRLWRLAGGSFPGRRGRGNFTLTLALSSPEFASGDPSRERG